MNKNELRKKLTDFDFSNHIHTVDIIKNTSDIFIRVDSLRKENSESEYIRFINNSYGMSVFGDCGNWIFDRPFIPEKESYINVPYWLEKLHANSIQSFNEFDFSEIEKDINQKISEIENNKEDYCKPDELIRAYIQLLDNCFDDIAYLNAIYNSTLNNEDIPIYKLIPKQLLIVFDAFNEICIRLEQFEK